MVRNDHLYLLKLKNMKQFIVIDKMEGFSWVNDCIEGVMESMGYDSSDGGWEQVKEKAKDIYEVIEVEGNIKYIMG